MKPIHFAKAVATFAAALVLCYYISNTNFYSGYSRLKYFASNDKIYEHRNSNYFEKSRTESSFDWKANRKSKKRPTYFETRRTECLSDWKANRKSKNHPTCAKLNNGEAFSDAGDNDFNKGCKQAMKVLQDTVFDRIQRLQNIKDCSNAALFVCSFGDGHGFGSFIHVTLKCFFAALGTNRTMVLKVSEKYRNVDEVFLPRFPSSCANRDISNAILWNYMKIQKPNENEIPVIETPSSLNRNSKKTEYAPFNMPQNIAGPLECCHGNPNAWWIGQMVKYFMRPQAWVINQLNKVKNDIGFSHPIVGIHIRRTDKIKVARYYDLESYMTHVEQWYECQSLKNVTKKVYLATDDLKVLDEAKSKYPKYVFLSDPLNKNASAVKKSRYIAQGLMEIVRDIMILKDCDFFVGTFSSNVGRIVQDLRQADGDRSFDAVSLDESYNFHFGYPQFHLAISDHKVQRKGEMQMKVGDKILMNKSKSTLITGFGKNTRSGKIGTYPTSKVRLLASTADFLAFN